MFLVVSCGLRVKPLDFQFLDITDAEGLFLQTGQTSRSVTSRSVETEGSLYKICDGTSELVKAKDSNSNIIDNLNFTYRYLKVLNKDWIILNGYYLGADYLHFDGYILCNSTTGKVYILQNYCDDYGLSFTIHRDVEPKIVGNSLYLPYEKFGHQIYNLYKIDLTNPDELQMQLYLQDILPYVISDNGTIIFSYYHSEVSFPSLIKYPNGKVDYFSEYNVFYSMHSIGNNFLDIPEHGGCTYYVVSDFSYNKYDLDYNFDDDRSKIIKINDKYYLFDSDFRLHDGDPNNYYNVLILNDISNLPVIDKIMEFKSISFIDYIAFFDESKILIYGSNSDRNSKNLVCYDMNTNTEVTVHGSENYYFKNMESMGDKVVISAIRKSDGKNVLLYCDGSSLQSTEEVTHEIISIHPIN